MFFKEIYSSMYRIITFIYKFSMSIYIWWWNFFHFFDWSDNKMFEWCLFFCFVCLIFFFFFCVSFYFSTLKWNFNRFVCLEKKKQDIETINFFLNIISGQGCFNYIYKFKVSLFGLNSLKFSLFFCYVSNL